LYELTNKYFQNEFFNKAKDDWKKYKLQDLVTTINGYSYKGKELVEESNIGMATIKNFERTGGFKENGFKAIIPTKEKDSHYVELNDILVACTDLTQNADIIGNAIMLLNKGSFEKIILSMDLVKVSSKEEWLSNYIVFGILNSQNFKNFALGYKSGTTVLHLNKDCLKEFEVKIPNKEKLKEISNTIKNNYSLISNNMIENQTLQQLRDTLLPKLMNGEIDLDKIEI